jgi:hypothetical protein
MLYKDTNYYTFWWGWREFWFEKVQKNAKIVAPLAKICSFVVWLGIVALFEHSPHRIVV